ncbi:hypothetical protein [Vibrio mangrovi]|nr:hypothetical protein [Vibrio mangrovi]MDW6003272.1 hypothetical protein [Vibrio mangrovi]
MENIDTDIAVAMSYVRRAQKLTFKDLDKRFSGIKTETLKRYMQQSYPSMRPLHFLAAYSWVTMVPMTCFYYRILYPELDDDILEAMMCIGQLPSGLFDTILEIISIVLDESSRQSFIHLRETLESQLGGLHHYDDCFPPETLDLHAFAIDYYRSVAMCIQTFRAENNISVEMAASVIGLSVNQYDVLEDIHNTTPFPASIGIRAKLGFQLESYAGFSGEMRLFPEFHQLRCIQHARELLIRDGLKKVSSEQRKHIMSVISTLSLLKMDERMRKAAPKHAHVLSESDMGDLGQMKTEAKI